MDKKKITLLYFLFAGILLMNASFVYALEVPLPGLGNNPSLPEYAKYIFNIGMAIAGILAVTVIAFGGVYYLVDLGRGSFEKEGKEWVKAGMLGLLLTVSSYLIAYTINPALVVFDLKSLSPLTFMANYFNPPGPSTPVEVYNEIPLGTLTETLLSRTMDCYNYDDNGDPIDGDEITTDDDKKIIGPTYLEHDRVDCFLKLGQAVEKKAQTLKKVSDEIVKLMQLCSCGDGTFTFTGSGSSVTGGSPVYTSNGQGCKNPFCAAASSVDQNGETADCKYSTPKKCTINSNCIGSTKPCKDSCSNKGCTGGGDRCPPDAKKKMEHGPITIPDCDGQGKDFAGLDEFRSQFSNNYTLIKNKVEVQPSPKVNEKPITIIKNGNCQRCDSQCQTCDPSDKKYADCMKKRQQCQKDKLDCQKNRQQCLKQNSPWYNLRLVDQIIYFEGKINEMKAKVKADLDNLKKGEASLGQCYIADTYIDFLKAYEQTNKETKVLLIQKTFSDPEAGKSVNPAKHCLGFQYNNSSCYSQCQKACPESADDIRCYSNCACDPEDGNCLKNQNECTKQCQGKQKCKLSNSFGVFQDCMSSCKQQCLDNCDKMCPGNDKNKCQNDCNNNSKCLLENENKCLINVSGLKDCVKKYSEDESLKNCADNTTLCRYCSDQYAGYPECLNSPYSLQGKYSSSFIYQNLNYQKCPDPYKVIYGINNDINGNKIKYTCIEGSPQTAKCPSASKCPQCPCDIVNETINYLPDPTLPKLPADPCGSSGPTKCPCPNGPDSPDCCLKTTPGGCQTRDPYLPGYCKGTCSITGACSSSPGGSGSSKKITEYRVCSGTCDSYAYNDDPLTFYCQQSWWFKEETKDELPVGNERICPKKNEIPVGKTVDDAEAWGQEFINNIDKVALEVHGLVNYMKNIAEKKDYCKCDSKCELTYSNGQPKPVCQARCTYNQTEKSTTTMTYPDGTTTEVEVPPHCWCTRQGCAGSPCQLMIDLLLGPGTFIDGFCAKGAVGIESFYVSISNVVKDFIVFTIQQNRSDIVKELSYSRQKTNQCSTVQNNYGVKERILSCTRVEDEIIYPVTGPGATMKTIVNGTSTSSYCYGKALGQILKTSEPLADNWFCCEERQKGQQ